MCDYICRVEYILQVLWCISMPLYISVLLTIIRYKKTEFAGSFWTLCLSLGVADLIHLLVFQVTLRMVPWGYFNDLVGRDKAFSAWVMAITEHAAVHAESLGVLLISINRYTKLTKSNNTHNKLWSTKSVICCIVAQWVIPWFIMIPLYPVKATLVPNVLNNNTGFISIPEDFPAFLRYYGVVFGLGGGLFSCTLSFLYGSMFLKTYRHSKMMAKTGTKVQRNGTEKMFKKAEFRLSCMMFIVVLFQFGIVLHSISICLHAIFGWDVSAGVFRWFNFRIGVLVDLYGYSNGYLLLFFSTPVREQYLKLWCRRQPDQTRVISNQANGVAVRRTK